MSKLKTNSSAKKRFKVTASGKIKFKQAGKRHGMVKKSQSQIRKLRKGAILNGAETANLLKGYMPYDN